MKKILKSLIAVVVLYALTTGCMVMADRIQTSNGNVEIIKGTIVTEKGNLTYKLYKPVSATATNKAPAVLLLHGYQNDSETCSAYSIELARRGAVVMALDEYGHGYTDIGLINRGYVNHKVTVNYGQDSETDGTYVEIGGANRYKLMMNFSNLSFFLDKYTKDSAGNTVADSSCGGIDGYAVLASLEYVDNTRMAVSGHSMGTWSSWSVAAAYSQSDIAPKAVVLQCGELFTDDAYDTSKYSFNNVLLLQAKYDEFSYFRDYQMVVDDELLKSDLRTEFLGTTADKAKWNTTFGSFTDGTARRMELLNTNHRLTTHNDQGLTVALQWFADSIGLKETIPFDSHIAMTKELLVLAAMILTIIACLPIMNILLATPVFKSVAVGLPPVENVKKPGKWIKSCVITILLAASSYPFMTQLGHGLLPLPENIFRMTVGNGFVSWYSLLIIIMIVTSIISNIKNKKKGVVLTLDDKGLGNGKGKFSIILVIKAIVLAALMAGYVYFVTWLFTKEFMLDLRIIWPFFKPFTSDRIVQFCVYIPFFAIFYILNNSKIFAGLRSKSTYKEGFFGFISCWWKYALAMAGSVLVLCCLEYIPFFANIGPGADVLFGFTFGGPFMSLLILFGPQVIAFSLLCTYIYRKTGNVYTGAMFVAILACWIVTGGSAML